MSSRSRRDRDNRERASMRELGRRLVEGSLTAAAPPPTNATKDANDAAPDVAFGTMESSAAAFPPSPSAQRGTAGSRAFALLEQSTSPGGAGGLLSAMAAQAKEATEEAARAEDAEAAKDEDGDRDREQEASLRAELERHMSVSSPKSEKSMRRLTPKDCADRALAKVAMVSAMLNLEQVEPQLRHLRRPPPLPPLDLQDELERRLKPTGVKPSEYFSSNLRDIDSIIDGFIDDLLVPNFDSLDEEERLLHEETKNSAAMRRALMQKCNCGQRLDKALDDAARAAKLEARAEVTTTFSKMVVGAVSMIKVMESNLEDRDAQIRELVAANAVMMQKIEATQEQLAVVRDAVAATSSGGGGNANREAIEREFFEREYRLLNAMKRNLKARTKDKLDSLDDVVEKEFRSDAAMPASEKQQDARWVRRVMRRTVKLRGLRERCSRLERQLMTGHDALPPPERFNVGMQTLNEEDIRGTAAYERKRAKARGNGRGDAGGGIGATATGATAVVSQALQIPTELQASGWSDVDVDVPGAVVAAVENLLGAAKEIMCAVDQARVQVLEEVVPFIEDKRMNRALDAAFVWQSQLERLMDNNVESLRNALRMLREHVEGAMKELRSRVVALLDGPGGPQGRAGDSGEDNVSDASGAPEDGDCGDGATFGSAFSTTPRTPGGSRLHRLPTVLVPSAKSSFASRKSSRRAKRTAGSTERVERGDSAEELLNRELALRSVESAIGGLQQWVHQRFGREVPEPVKLSCASDRLTDVGRRLAVTSVVLSDCLPPAGAATATAVQTDAAETDASVMTDPVVPEVRIEYRVPDGAASLDEVQEIGMAANTCARDVGELVRTAREQWQLMLAGETVSQLYRHATQELHGYAAIAAELHLTAAWARDATKALEVHKHDRLARQKSESSPKTPGWKRTPFAGSLSALSSPLIAGDLGSGSFVLAGGSGSGRTRAVAAAAAGGCPSLCARCGASLPPTCGGEATATAPVADEAQQRVQEGPDSPPPPPPPQRNARTTSRGSDVGSGAGLGAPRLQLECATPANKSMVEPHAISGVFSLDGDASGTDDDCNERTSDDDAAHDNSKDPEFEEGEKKVADDDTIRRQPFRLDNTDPATSAPGLVADEAGQTKRRLPPSMPTLSPEQTSLSATGTHAANAGGGGSSGDGGDALVPSSSLSLRSVFTPLGAQAEHRTLARASSAALPNASACEPQRQVQHTAASPPQLQTLVAAVNALGQQLAASVRGSTDLTPLTSGSSVAHLTARVQAFVRALARPPSPVTHTRGTSTTSLSAATGVAESLRGPPRGDPRGSSSSSSSIIGGGDEFFPFTESRNEEQDSQPQDSQPQRASGLVIVQEGPSSFAVHEACRKLSAPLWVASRALCRELIARYSLLAVSDGPEPPLLPADAASVLCDGGETAAASIVPPQMAAAVDAVRHAVAEAIENERAGQRVAMASVEDDSGDGDTRRLAAIGVLQRRTEHLEGMLHAAEARVGEMLVEREALHGLLRDSASAPPPVASTPLTPLQRRQLKKQQLEESLSTSTEGHRTADAPQLPSPRPLAALAKRPSGADWEVERNDRRDGMCNAAHASTSANGRPPQQRGEATAGDQRTWADGAAPPLRSEPTLIGRDATAAAVMRRQQQQTPTSRSSPAATMKSPAQPAPDSTATDASPQAPQMQTPPPSSSSASLSTAGPATPLPRRSASVALAAAPTSPPQAAPALTPPPSAPRLFDVEAVPRAMSVAHGAGSGTMAAAARASRARAALAAHHRAPSTAAADDDGTVRSASRASSVNAAVVLPPLREPAIPLSAVSFPARHSSPVKPGTPGWGTGSLLSTTASNTVADSEHQHQQPPLRGAFEVVSQPPLVGATPLRETLQELTETERLTVAYELLGDSVMALHDTVLEVIREVHRRLRLRNGATGSTPIPDQGDPLAGALGSDDTIPNVCDVVDADTRLLLALRNLLHHDSAVAAQKVRLTFAKIRTGIVRKRLQREKAERQRAASSSSSPLQQRQRQQYHLQQREVEFIERQEARYEEQQRWLDKQREVARAVQQQSWRAYRPETRPVLKLKPARFFGLFDDGDAAGGSAAAAAQRARLLGTTTAAAEPPPSTHLHGFSPTGAPAATDAFTTAFMRRVENWLAVKLTQKLRTPPAVLARVRAAHAALVLELPESVPEGRSRSVGTVQTPSSAPNEQPRSRAGATPSRTRSVLMEAAARTAVVRGLHPMLKLRVRDGTPQLRHHHTVARESAPPDDRTHAKQQVAVLNSLMARSGDRPPRPAPS